jgi:hypothetical protein
MKFGTEDPHMMLLSSHEFHENRAVKATFYLMVQMKSCWYFPNVSSDLDKTGSRRCPQKFIG